MPALDLRDALSIVTAIVTVVGVFFALRFSVAKLELGQVEVLRQLKALHERLDRYGERLTTAERDHAVLTERVDNLRQSQRFKLAKQDMFRESEVGE